MIGKYALRFGVLGYLTLLLALPVGMVFYRAFEHGFWPAWHAITTPEAKHALLLTVEVASIAVVCNTIFGVTLAIALVRHRFPGSGFVNALVDLPLAVSPVVVGLSLYLLYGTGGWFGGHGILFSTPAIVLATMFVSLPFVVREVVPVLREIGTEQEQAASTLGAGSMQTFRRITFPAIRWAVAYGVVLTMARAIGEYGAVSVVSGNVEGKTQTMTLYVQGQFENNIFDLTGAYAASVLLALIALVTVVAMTVFKPREGI
jgi:sulfate/thiosulfate transport system permease protein